MFRRAVMLVSTVMLSACAQGTSQTALPHTDTYSDASSITRASLSYEDSALPTPKLKPAIGVAHASEQFVASADTLDDSELDQNRGTFSPEILNSTVLEATTSQNVAVNSVTGSNIIDNNSFTNTQGLVNLIQNSGNNVVIQSSTIVNLTFQ